jgi:hypothetical protein
MLAHMIFPAPQRTLRLLSHTAHTIPSTPRRDCRFHLRDWCYAAISLGAQVGVRGDTPTLKAIEPPPSAPPHTHALRRRAEGGVADAPLLGRRRPTSTTGAACGNAVAGRGYFGVPVPTQPPNGLSEL